MRVTWKLSHQSKTHRGQIHNGKLNWKTDTKKAARAAVQEKSVLIETVLATVAKKSSLCKRYKQQYRKNHLYKSCPNHFHLSPRLCPSTAGCSPPSVSSIVFCLLHSCFTFHLGFVHPLQDVALHQCLPLSSVCCFPVPGGSLLPCYVVLSSSAWSSSWSLPSPSLPLCAAFGPPVVLHSWCMSGPSPLLFQCVFYNVNHFFLVSEHGILSCRCRFNIFISNHYFEEIVSGKRTYTHESQFRTNRIY